jgi:hypothetical protein
MICSSRLSTAASLKKMPDLEKNRRSSLAGI